MSCANALSNAADEFQMIMMKSEAAALAQSVSYVYHQRNKALGRTMHSML